MRFLWILFALCLTACEPMGPVAGGSLAGNTTAAPDEWSAISTVENVLIETNPDDPYSVTVWGVDTGANYYVASGDGGDTRWAENLVANPGVKLKIGDTLYALNAVRVTDSTELSTVFARYVAKYDLDPTKNFAKDAWVFRLDRP